MVKYSLITGAVCSLALGLAGAAKDPCVMNDNYCDCGYDEPETSACSFYTTDSFHCKSTVFSNQKIPLSRVDDGVCDCCDGSDESIGCDNTCAALEKQRVEAEEAEASRRQAGLLAQTQLVGEANALYEQKLGEGAEAKKRSVDLVTMVENAKGEVTAATKAEYEESQASVEDLRALTEDHRTRVGGVLARDAVLSALSYGTLHGGKSVLEALILDVEKILPESASVDTEKAVDALHSFTTLRESCQSEDGASATAAADKDFNAIAQALQTHLSLNVLETSQLSELTFDIYEHLYLDCEGAGVFSRGSAVKAAVDEACDVRRKYQSKKADRILPVETLQLKLSEAREKLSTLENELKSIKLKAAEYDDIMKKDFGPNKLLFLFYKKCFEMQRDKYYYSICPYGVAKQDSTTLGKFDSLERRHEQIIFKFGYGDNCFATKRPRELSLSMQCGSEAKLVEIAEPETCSYAAILETPIAC